MNLPFIKDLSFRKLCGKNILHFSRRMSKYLLWMIFVGVMGWLGYFWYLSVYAYGWTEEQKNQYRNEYAGETSFREERFNRTVGVLKERIQLHQTRPTVRKDIFLGKDL